jgi:hypothetical protein
LQVSQPFFIQDAVRAAANLKTKSGGFATWLCGKPMAFRSVLSFLFCSRLCLVTGKPQAVALRLKQSGVNKIAGGYFDEER